MGTRVPIQSKKNPIREPIQYRCEDLIRLLVSQVTAQSMRNSSIDTRTIGECNEEIIVDVDLDGSHYVLIRLSSENRTRVQLSPREQEIVRMVARGHSNKIIADALRISSWTVCTHLRRIFAKLGVSSRAAMVAKSYPAPSWDYRR